MQMTSVIDGEARRLLLVMRIVAPRNGPLWVLLIREAQTRGFFLERTRDIDCV